MVRPLITFVNYFFSSFVTGLFDLGFSWVEIGSVTPKPQVRLNLLISVLPAERSLAW